MTRMTEVWITFVSRRSLITFTSLYSIILSPKLQAIDKKSTSPGVDAYGQPIPMPGRNALGQYQIQVLIPKTASASLIGKGGATVKRMTEITSCKYQFGDESDPFGTKERIVTIFCASVPNLVLVK